MSQREHGTIWFWVLGIIAVAVIAWAIYGSAHVTKSDGYGTPATQGDPP